MRSAPAPGEDGRWLLDVRYTVFQNEENEWSLAVAGNELLAVTVNGRELPLHLRAGSNRCRPAWAAASCEWYAGHRSASGTASGVSSCRAC